MFLDLVIVTHDNSVHKYTFQAPFNSGLKEGDRVVCDTQYGESLGTVLDCLAVEKDDKRYNFITNAMSTTEPLRKIISKVEYRKFQYNDEEGEG